jgi:hypothetical protein
MLQMALLLLLVQNLVSGIDWRSLLTSGAKIAVAAAAMFATLNWIQALGVVPEPTLASRGWYLFGQIMIGGLVFIAVARMIGAEELQLAWQTTLAKFEQNIIPPPENREVPIA